MDSKVGDIDKARYWKEQGYSFDPNSLTAAQMDEAVHELREQEFWTKSGYYYDPNTETVYLSRGSKKTLASEPLIRGDHGRSTRYGLRSVAVPSDIGGSVFSGPINLSHSGQACLNTGSGYSVRENIDSGSYGTAHGLLCQPEPGEIGDSLTTLPPSLYTPVLSRRGSTQHGDYLGALGINKYHPDSLANPYGAGSPYKADGLMNAYSQYGSPYSNKSWRNPYATDAPRLYDSEGNYRGKLSSNPYDPDSTSNPYGKYGSKFSPDSINNPYGAGNPYLYKPIYVVPSTE